MVVARPYGLLEEGGAMDGPARYIWLVLREEEGDLFWRAYPWIQWIFSIGHQIWVSSWLSCAVFARMNVLQYLYICVLISKDDMN